MKDLKKGTRCGVLRLLGAIDQVHPACPRPAKSSGQSSVSAISHFIYFNILLASHMKTRVQGVRSQFLLTQFLRKINMKAFLDA